MTANHDVAFYADYLGMSPDHLTRRLKATTGMSAKTIIQRDIGERATALLDSGATVAGTAGSLGFDRPSYFSRFYRRVCGAAPTSRRRE